MIYALAGIMLMLMLGGFWLFRKGRKAAEADQVEKALDNHNKIIDGEKTIETDYDKANEDLHNKPSGGFSGLWNRIKGR